jgi:hypothetical protein
VEGGRVQVLIENPCNPVMRELGEKISSDSIGKLLLLANQQRNSGSRYFFVYGI